MEFSDSIIDSVALAWFLACWWGYLLYTNRINRTRKCLRCMMDHWRETWALSILKREPRIMDSQIINGLVSKETFFASTTILILASCIALMGLHDEVSNLLSDLPFAEPISRTLWEIKVMILILIFVYAFFKFSWSIRQHSYSGILLGSLPPVSEADTPQAQTQARRLAGLSNLGARNFNDGLRAYYFALAELGWFIHPLIFIAATVWVVLVLYRREYHSRTLRLLLEDHPPDRML
jgi:uncharacterized membrane protein